MATLIKKKSAAKHAPYNWRTDGITQSLLTAFVHCRRLCAYQLDHWEPTRTKDALVFGSLWHTVMEYYGNAIKLRKIPPSFNVIAADARKRKLVPYGDQKAETMMAMAQALYEGYCLMWVKKDSATDFTFVEQVCDRQLSAPFPAIRYRGKIDAGARVKSKLWVVERKTKAQLDEGNLTNALAFDFQNQSYTFLAEEKFQENVAGVLYDVVSKPQHRFTDKDTVQTYYSKISEAIKAEPGKFFNRYEIAQPKENKEEFIIELRTKLSEFVLWREGKSPTYPNQAACIGRGVCDFLECCGSRSMVGCAQTRVLFRELL